MQTKKATQICTKLKNWAFFYVLLVLRVKKILINTVVYVIGLFSLVFVD